MNGFTRFSIYPVADYAFEAVNIGGGISAQQSDQSPEFMPCAWGIDGNHQDAIKYVTNYTAGGIDQITIYSTDGSTVIPTGARLQIKGVSA